MEMATLKYLKFIFSGADTGLSRPGWCYVTFFFYVRVLRDFFLCMILYFEVRSDEVTMSMIHVLPELEISKYQPTGLKYCCSINSTSIYVRTAVILSACLWL